MEIFLLLPLLITNVFGTTEWFGDLRAHMNPPAKPPFYDIVYDESDCPYGLESIAIPEYVYFGEMMATKSVREHSQCLQFCLETTGCKAVNYFDSIDKGDKGMGFCELLAESQYDNPRLMRPFRKATYYEKIRCRTAGEEEEQPFEFDGSGKETRKLLLGEVNEQAKDGTERHGKAHKAENGTNKNAGREAVTKPAKVTTTVTPESEGKSMKGNSRPTADDSDRGLALKKLAAKIQEFNLSFRSRR